MANLFKNITFIKFILVGIVNTIIGLSLMLIFYNIFLWGYWLSSAISYIIASIISYFLNKHFTFKSTVRNLYGIIRFSILIGICYILSYSIAKPLTFFILKSFNLPINIVEQIAMIIGMVIFSLLNYVGQKLWVFK